MFQTQNDLKYEVFHMFAPTSRKKSEAENRKPENCLLKHLTVSNVSSDFCILQLHLKRHLHLEVVLQGTQANESTSSQFWKGQTKSSELLEMDTTPDLTTLNVLIFARIKFRDSRIFLKTDFSRVLNFANRHI